jgi:hypothetical protein
MKPVLIAGILIVNLALLSYATAIVMQARKRMLNRTIMIFLTIGVFLDITSTICMIVSSGKILTLHGIIGYSSLAGMLTDTILSYRFIYRSGFNAILSQKFIRWSTTAFLYWIAAYITGAVLVMIR